MVVDAKERTLAWRTLARALKKGMYLARVGDKTTAFGEPGALIDPDVLFDTSELVLAAALQNGQIVCRQWVMP
jgi:hypothetical protein